MNAQEFNASIKGKKLKILSDNFGQHTGTDNYYKTFFPELYYTDGVQDAAESLQAYWLIDAIVSYAPDTRKHDLVFWSLTSYNETALLECRLDSGLPPIITQFIEYTDFPEGIFKIWQGNGVIYLPSEH